MLSSQSCALEMVFGRTMEVKRRDGTTVNLLVKIQFLWLVGHVHDDVAEENLHSDVVRLAHG